MSASTDVPASAIPDQLVEDDRLERPLEFQRANYWPRIPGAVPHSSEEIVATQGRCLTVGYATPARWYVNKSVDQAFAHGLLMALRLLKEKRAPRQELYGGEADESRLGHTPPETRARFSSDDHDKLRLYMRGQVPSTPGHTPLKTPDLVQDIGKSSSDSSPQSSSDSSRVARDRPTSPTSVGKGNTSEVLNAGDKSSSDFGVQSKASYRRPG